MRRRSWPSAQASRSSNRKGRAKHGVTFSVLGAQHSDRLGTCAVPVVFTSSGTRVGKHLGLLLKFLCCSWASSSAGRAPRSQRGGRRFDPGLVHQTTLLCESRMLHPAFGVMRPEELVFILANSARRGIREPSVVDSIRKLRESDLPPQPFSIPTSRTFEDSCCS